MSTQRYPQLKINLPKIYQNSSTIVRLCDDHNITVTGVVKGCAGLPEVAEQMALAGCRQIASSRLEQLIRIKEFGIDIPLMMLRIPMLSEVSSLVDNVDISLNSEQGTLVAIDEACAKLNTRHRVILMYDVGDLREGVFDRQALIELAVFVERKLSRVQLLGIGTNMTCYGAIRPTVVNTQALCDVAAEIEMALGRRLDVISAGTTTSLPLLLKGHMPERVNNLRIGAGILTPTELETFWKCSIPQTSTDTFVLEAEIIEISSKPTYPIGEIFIDAFGNYPKYNDRGFRKRAILAVGDADLGDCHKLLPFDPQLTILGASSDHMIVDIQDSRFSYHIGDTIEFKMLYQPMLFLSNNASVKKGLWVKGLMG